MLLYPIQAYTSMCVYMCTYVCVYNRTRPASFLWIDNSCLSTRPASKVVRAIACVHVCSSAQAYTRMYTYVPCHNHHSPSNQLAVRPSGHAQQRNQADALPRFPQYTLHGPVRAPVGKEKVTRTPSPSSSSPTCSISFSAFRAMPLRSTGVQRKELVGAREKSSEARPFLGCPRLALLFREPDVSREPQGRAPRDARIATRAPSRPALLAP
jgi:hypothetical protein